jgi:hypothetical protein
MLARNLGRSQALTAGILALVLAPSAMAATGRVSANILQAVIVTEIAPMSFAAVAPPPGGGTIMLTPTGAISAASGFVFHGTPSPGTFHARGAPNYPASISLSTGNTVTGPGPAMRFATFMSRTPTAFDSTAALNIAVGAALTVNPNQTPGDYSGTYAVTVNY